jgi:glutamyl-tRNA synthetase
MAGLLESAAVAIVTRFPPSPTGALHIGGARTALFCWAFARHHGGRFLLRFEDTDRARSSVESEAGMLEALDWLGLDHDPVPGFEGVPRQSERLGRYQEILGQLLESRSAYRCSCSTERLEGLRRRAQESGSGGTLGYDGHCRDLGIGPDADAPYCVRLRVPENGRTRWADLIAGPSGEDASQLDDFVLARTDGTPIYHLAVVVDDHDMGVTHVIRGREHMNSTPRQLLLYQALGWEAPEFAHVPLLVGGSGKKLSKREQSVSVQSYRERGFTPEAVLNFIARLGWGHGDLEIFDRDELVELFSLEGVGRAPSQVHEDKLLWISQQYLKALPMPQLIRYAQPFLNAAAGGEVEVDAGLEQLLDLLRERSHTLAEMAEKASFYFAEEIELEGKAARKQLRPAIAAALGELRDALEAVEEWGEGPLERAFHQVVERHDLKLGQLAQPTRVAIVGGTASPGIFETLQLLGRDRSLKRIEGALRYIERGAAGVADPAGNQD